MSGLASAIPAAIDSVLAHLRTVAGTYTDPQSLIIIDGDMGTNVPPCFVEIGSVVNWLQMPAGLGNLRRDEFFELDGIVQWFDGGSGPDVASTVRTNAFGVLAALVLQLINDPSLGGSVRFAQVIGGPAMTQGTTASGGWSVQVPFRVRCDIQLER